MRSGSWRGVAETCFHRLPAAMAVLLLAGCAARGGFGEDTRDASCEMIDSGSVAAGFVVPEQVGMPEIAGVFTPKETVYARNYMAVTANPLATATAGEVLAQGGSAIDAAIAAQMVLNLVEPQSSGIGGGAFMLYFDAATREVVAYDGRETAPAAATENYLRWIDNRNCTTPLPGIRASGRAIGTPGLLRMLEQAHGDYGRLPWQSLFQPAIRMALEGFRISPRLASSIESAREQLWRDPRAAVYFLNSDGTAKKEGTLLQNPALAATFNIVARDGVKGFYHGAIAEDVVDSVADARGGMTPGRMMPVDLYSYCSLRREAVCTTYRGYLVCGMPPPSSGGTTVAAVLGILENFDMGSYAPASLGQNGGLPSTAGVHLITEAERLAYADRNKYVADSDFVPLPGDGWETLLDKRYLASRAAMIDPEASMGTALAGELGEVPLGVDRTEERGTSHMSIVDQQGNVVVLTTTIESAFGSYHMTRSGFLLNNQLSDFSVEPTDGEGAPLANRIAPGKRPRSSMAPTLVFRPDAVGSPEEFVMAVGSSGGAAIIQHVVKALVGVLDWGLDAQQSVSLVSFGAANGPITTIGGEHPLVDSSDNGDNDPLISGLRALGHTVSFAAQTSGLASIVRTEINGRPALSGGADPRREGTVAGDTFLPIWDVLKDFGITDAAGFPGTRLPESEYGTAAGSGDGG